MFGNRKRKLEDEEESLVPHGLIWHATAEPTPEEVKKNEEALGYTINYAQEIERVRRQQSAQPLEQAQNIAPQAPPAKPAATPWWRVQPPEAPVERPISKLTPMPLSAYVPTPIEPAKEPALLSRILPMEVRPTPVQPINIQRVAVPPAAIPPIQATSTSASAAPPAQILQASASQVEASLAKSIQVQASPIAEPVLHSSPHPKPQHSERLVPKTSEISESLRLVFSRLQSAAETAWIGLGSVVGKSLENGRRTLGSLELGDRLARVGKQGQNLTRSGMAKTNLFTRRTGTALGAFSRAGVSHVRQMSARVRKASTTTTGDVVRPANRGPSTPSRVRVLLAASALQTRIITGRQLAEWRLRRERMAIDSRFWASMTMAAIAAIIALVIVSVVPHYAAKSLPSRLLNTNPSVDANVAAPAAATATPVHKVDAPLQKTAATSRTQATASKSDSARADSANAAANPKPKHIVQDDYVAPNTYKYYGSGSKASR
jgi:hypothetical protein